MGLTAKDRKFLLSWGYEERDFQQIERATRKSNTSYTLGVTPIDREEAIQLLGRENYLSGIARSAFHSSAVRETDDGRTVYFDSSRLFKGRD